MSNKELADRLRMLETVLRESHETGMRVAQSAEELGLSVLEQDVANVIGDADLLLQAADAMREAVEALRPNHVGDANKKVRELVDELLRELHGHVVERPGGRRLSNVALDEPMCHLCQSPAYEGHEAHKPTCVILRAAAFVTLGAAALKERRP